MVEVSAGIVISNGRVLCMQKGIAKYPYLSNKYEFPGGKIEKDEQPEEALIREFKEELHSDISSSKLIKLNRIEYHYPDFDVTLHNFIIETERFEFTLTEHQSYVWSDPKELRKLDWAAADLLIIPALEEYLAK